MSSITSTAMQGLNKAEATVTEVAQSVASGNAQTSEGSQIIAGAGASLTGGLVALALAKVGFEANAATIKIGDAMFQTLLDSI
jgi:hypothetical protein